MFTMKRIVGVGGSLMFTDGGMFPGYGKSYVNDDYIQAVLAGGGVPLLVPVIEDEAAIEAQVACLDALVISGGWDVDPLLWGEEPHAKLGGTLPARTLLLDVDPERKESRSSASAAASRYSMSRRAARSIRTSASSPAAPCATGSPRIPRSRRTRSRRCRAA